MPWEWSHSQEAYADLQQHIAAQDREWLEVVYAEWHARRRHNPDRSREDHDSFSQANYARGLARAKLLAGDTLAEFIYERASEQALCENGGREAWCCPYGCGPHTLPWSKAGTGRQ